MLVSNSRAGMKIIVDKLSSKNSITPANPGYNAYHLNIALIHEAGAWVSDVVEHVLLTQHQSEIPFPDIFAADKAVTPEG